MIKTSPSRLAIGVQYGGGQGLKADNSFSQWLDLTKVLSDEKGRLAKEYCYDGLHLNAQGFEVVSENIIPLLK